MLFLGLGSLIVLVLLIISFRKEVSASPPPNQSGSNPMPNAAQTTNPLRVNMKTITPRPECKVGAVPRALGYEDLNSLTQVSAGNPTYTGPVLEQVLDVPNASYKSVFCYDVDGNHREIKRNEVAHWMVGVSKGGAPLSSLDNGPYFLIDRRDVANNFPRVVRIKAE